MSNNQFSSSDHLRYLAEFCKYVVMAGGATPHMLMVSDAAKEYTLDRKLWMGGCYVAVYNYPTAEIIWNTWNPDNIKKSELLEWIRINWKGLPLRRERKAVRSPEKLMECILSYVEWSKSITDKQWFYDKSLDPITRYELAWNDIIDNVKYVARYISIRYLEFMRRTCNVDLYMPDIRPRDGKYPRQALSLIFPESSKVLLGGNTKEELDEVNRLATLCLNMLKEEHNVVIDYYTLQSLSCEYKQSVLGRRQYPGRSLDSELGYWNKVYDHFHNDILKSKMYDVRKRIFPDYSLGELQGWNGSRDVVGTVLTDYRYTWSDALFDYIKTTDFSNPVRKNSK